MQLFANNVTVFINQSISSVDTKIFLDDVSKLPIISGSDYFTITFFVNTNGIESNWEVVKVTSVTGNECTAVRGFESTTAEWAAGSVGQMRITKNAMETATSNAATALGNSNSAIEIADNAMSEAVIRVKSGDLAASSGASIVGFLQNREGAVTTDVETVLRENVSVKRFGAVGDGVTDDSVAFRLAIATNTTVLIPAGVYRLASNVSIPNSCFTRFVGEGNLAIPASKIFVDFNGPVFTSAAENTSFYCFENIYAYSTAAYPLAQFIKDQGTAVHCKLLRLGVTNFKSKAIQLASAFRCDIEFLGTYCWDYMLTIASGSANKIKFTADHSYAGGIDVTGIGFVIDPYTEMICSDNDPSGENASWREMKISGGSHTILGGVLSVHPNNNKFPIDLQFARAISFVGVSPFGLGAAPYWINVDSTDSSFTAVNSPGLTYGGVTTNVITIDSGYTPNGPDVRLGSQSLRNTCNRVWAVINGGDGTLKQWQGIIGVERVGVGAYRIKWPSGTFDNTNYCVSSSSDSPDIVSYRYNNKQLTQVDVLTNQSNTGAALDVYELSVKVAGI